MFVPVGPLFSGGATPFLYWGHLGADWYVVDIREHGVHPGPRREPQCCAPDGKAGTMSARAWLMVAVPILYVGTSTRCYMASKDVAKSLSQSMLPFMDKASVLLGRAVTELSRALLGQAKQIDKSHVIVQ